MDGAYPSFTFSDQQAANDNDFDFNVLSEYLFEEEKYPTPHQPNAMSTSSKSDDVSDQEDFSSCDEADGKRRKGSNSKSLKSQDQIDRRRERNRVLARKTRLRKKFFFESLQKQVTQLAAENDLLKGVIKQRLDNEDVKCKILSQCKAELPDVVTANSELATSVLGKGDFNLVTAIQAAQRSFVITDPSLPDNPIIFASKGFLDMCGYQLEEVLGRNCRFLQGPGTDPKQVEVLRQGIRDGTDTSVCMLNYKADGTQFYNQIFVAALRDASNKIINYVGVQVEIKHDSSKDNSEAASVTTTISGGSKQGQASTSSAGTGGSSTGSGTGSTASSRGGNGKRSRNNYQASSSASSSSSSTMVASTLTKSSGGISTSSNSNSKALVASQQQAQQQQLASSGKSSASMSTTSSSLSGGLLSTSGSGSGNDPQHAPGSGTGAAVLKGRGSSVTQKLMNGLDSTSFDSQQQFPAVPYTGRGNNPPPTGGH